MSQVKKTSYDFRARLAATWGRIPLTQTNKLIMPSDPESAKMKRERLQHIERAMSKMHLRNGRHQRKAL